MFNSRLPLCAIASFLLVVCAAPLANGQGIAVTGVGPVNRSMGGAGTAAPLDAIGSLHWNPASISYLPQSEVSFGLEGLLSDIELSSSVGGTTNTTNGEAGVAVVPAVGWVDHLEGTPLTIGLGVYGIGGFRNNMPKDTSNPLLASGPLFADAEIMQIAPTMSVQLGERWSIGFAPTLSAARMQFDPLGPSAITPNSVSGYGNRVHWGGGIQGGIYYASDSCWRAGFTIKSPQWFETFRFFTKDGVLTFNLDYPMILSGGLAYYGWEQWVFAADVRYFDYSNTAGFKEMGWKSVFAGAIGTQYQLNSLWKLRAGYNFNQNPIAGQAVFTNISSPLIQTNNIAMGASCLLTNNVELNLAYVYLVDNKVTGPLPSPPFGANDTISNRISAHSIVVGMQVHY